MSKHFSISYLDDQSRWRFILTEFITNNYFISSRVWSGGRRDCQFHIYTIERYHDVLGSFNNRGISGKKKIVQ